MSTTFKADLSNQVKTYWAPLFTRRLRESLLLGALVNKDYDGSITKEGDNVKVSQTVDPTGELRTIGVDGDSFSSEKASASQVTITANKRAVASLEFADEVELQTQIDRNSVQDGMIFAMQKQINNYLYSLVNPSTSAPDHLIASVSAVSLGALGDYRQLAAEAKWPMEGGWYALWSPQYWNDILTDTSLASRDFTGDSPVVNGQKSRRIMGFDMFEDNSRSGYYGLLFHPDFLHLVMQTSVSVKISDLHSQKKFGVLMSVDVIFGAGLGISGANKHIKIYNT